MEAKHRFCIFSATVLALLSVATCYFLWRDTALVEAQIIHDDVMRLSDILKQIDSSCDILSIRSERNQIDFLNVKSFAGSEVGPLNLAHPDKWHGPYMPEVLTYKGIPYEIVQVKNDYYVFPGRGVTLPTKYTVGKDLDVVGHKDITKLFVLGGALNYKNHVMGVKLDFVVGDWDVRTKKEQAEQKTTEKIEEFSQQLPFAQEHAPIQRA